jgi:hypothetical protein
MAILRRLLDIAARASRRRDRDELTSILLGPSTAYRSELIDAMSARHHSGT